MKIALVGIIKNEAHDILYWLAWHALLGVNSFILFDDDSQDGTRDLIKAASLHWDIRLFHVKEHSLDLTEQSHLNRQRQVYLDALNAIHDQYDWIGFLDTDEYAKLHVHQTLTEFLGSMEPDVGAVALHWQTYGHNGHITTPNLPPFHSFSRHSTQDEAINRHVKSFIRPSFWQKDEWVNVHYFPLKKGRYVTSSGQPINWSSTRGITEDQPDWSVANLMHFQNRSLEQFVGRARNRKDIQLLLDKHELTQWDEVEDTSPRRDKTVDALHWIKPVITSGTLVALEQIRTQHTPEHGLVPPCPRYNPTHFKIFALYPKDPRRPGLVNDLLCDTGDPNQPNDDFQLYMLQSQKYPRAAFLFGLDGSHTIKDFFLLHDSRLSGLPRYDILPVIAETAIALRQQGGFACRGQFLCSPPNEPLMPNRMKVALWECFYALPQEMMPSGESWLTLPAFGLAEMALQSPAFSLKTIAALTEMDRKTTAWLLPLLALYLNEVQHKELSSHLGALAPFIL
ncbi:glycosyltransferase family 2 protein [Bombella sp. TMW 2.2543]|uniref:Glycosyltransferase family 2 protein n=1 Tax=Bombella pluederhausensis TaxID=2967336 RepID=A0ABT3WI27_9PROT|nr:glycosyltransferase family 2 protein [Bombella pluederhausensis]MCX5617989.1 glycosyltransferase family 2 protein [Bombella pluederhausensis]